MKVLLTGATGFIGGHILQALRQAGHPVRAVARRPDAQPRWSGVEWIVGDFGRDTEPDAWRGRLTDIDVVINAVGIIREADGNTFAALHDAAPRALFTACAQAGVRKVIQISALGTDDAAPEPYFRFRRHADRQLESSSLDYVILRPSIVYGPGDHSMSFFKLLASLPVVPLVGDGETRVQPVHVADLVRAVLKAVEDPNIRRVAVDVGGAEALAFRAMLLILRRWAGLAPTRSLAIPLGLVRVGARLTDTIGRGPISGDELSMLQRGSTCDIAPFVRTFGFVPAPLEDGLGREPCTPRDRLGLAAELLRPVLRTGIAFIWLATGFITLFVYPWDQSLVLLAPTGLTGRFGELALMAICAFELVIGTLTLLGLYVRQCGMIQLILVLGFTVILSIASPEFWVHPYGPVTKNIPLLAATLMMIALEPKP